MSRITHIYKIHLLKLADFLILKRVCFKVSFYGLSVNFIITIWPPTPTLGDIVSTPLSFMQSWMCLHEMYISSCAHRNVVVDRWKPSSNLHLSLTWLDIFFCNFFGLSLYFYFFYFPFNCLKKWPYHFQWQYYFNFKNILCNGLIIGFLKKSDDIGDRTVSSSYCRRSDASNSFSIISLVSSLVFHCHQ